ncbi:MAG: macro domain-containing protein [Emergencia sp.]
MPFKIIRNDITKVKADAIVNTANPMPVYAAGTDKAVYEAAGADALLAERMKIGTIPRGGVAVTDAFALDAIYIIHTVGPAWKDGHSGEYETLKNCYLNSLSAAAELGCESIAFPLIATGVYGFPKDKALQIAISEISSFLFTHEMMVYLVVFDDKAFQLSENVVGEVESFIDANYVKASHRCEYREYGDSRRESRRYLRRRYEADGFDDERAELEAEEVMAMECVDKVRILNAVEPMHKLTVAAETEPSLEEQLAATEGSFQEKLFEHIARKGMNNTEVYKRANLDRKHFSKIQCNANYHPSKKTAMALCIALKLDLDESKDLLARAEWAFSPNRKTDLIVMNAILHQQYDINQVNAVLFSYGQECLGV